MSVPPDSVVAARALAERAAERVKSTTTMPSESQLSYARTLALASIALSLSAPTPAEQTAVDIREAVRDALRGRDAGLRP